MCTKTVQGYFGDKQITRADFITRWVAQAHECLSIARTEEDHDAIMAMATQIEKMAGRKWDAMP